MGRIFQFLGNIQIKFIKNLLIRIGLHYYPLNMQEALDEDPFNYACCRDLFIRKLKPEARPINSESNSICSPSDGTITQLEIFSHNVNTLAKGHLYSLDELLATKQHNFNNGLAATVYLAPNNYHRVHMPIKTTITSMVYVPGELYSVDPKVCEQIPNLLAKNERVVIFGDSDYGQVALILVGALNVGNIHINWHGTVNHNHPKEISKWDYQDKQLVIQKGEEIGYFTFGSTVVALINHPNISIDEIVKTQNKITMGSKLANIN